VELGNPISRLKAAHDKTKARLTSRRQSTSASEGADTQSSSSDGDSEDAESSDKPVAKRRPKGKKTPVCAYGRQRMLHGVASALVETEEDFVAFTSDAADLK